MSNDLPLVSLRAATLGYDGVAVCKPSIWIFVPAISSRWPGPMAPARRRSSGRSWDFLPVISGLLARNCALNEFGYVPQSAALDSTFPITAREVVAMGGYRPA